MKGGVPILLNTFDVIMDQIRTDQLRIEPAIAQLGHRLSPALKSAIKLSVVLANGVTMIEHTYNEKGVMDHCTRHLMLLCNNVTMSVSPKLS